MIFKFAGASTADGYNPYRIMRDGFDWEVLDPHDSWSYIGYWGDHQVVYLLKLLEVSARYHPGALAGLLHAPRVHLRQRSVSHQAVRRAARGSAQHDRFRRRSRPRDPPAGGALGADGKALPGADGAPYRVNLAEKLLVLALARLFNYIPEAGLWMNTQRPEWNDANNALVGYGVSMVTLCYLRRFLAFCRGLFGAVEAPAVEVSAEVAEAFRRVAEALERHAGLLGGPISDRDRKRVLDALGARRQRLPRPGSTPGVFGRADAAHRRGAGRFLRRGAAAHRPFDSRQPARRRPLSLLQPHEGGMATGSRFAVSTRCWRARWRCSAPARSSAENRLALLDALRGSRLYRADQNSYVLYPDRKLPGFFEKNNIPAEAIAQSKALRRR